MDVENFLRNALDQKKIKTEQLSILKSKESEFLEKEKELSDLLKKAQSNYDNCLRSNLTGSVSNDELAEAKGYVKELTDSIGGVKENIKILAELKSKLTNELNLINSDISGQQAILCTGIIKEMVAEVSKDKKFYQKLISAYAVYYRSNEFPKHWETFLLKCFPWKEDNFQIALGKLKEDNELLRN